MALIEEDTVDYSFDSFINWGIIEYNICTLATKF
jgi:hypothetical protein